MKLLDLNNDKVLVATATFRGYRSQQVYSQSKERITHE
jgi:hypothetical protein